MEKWRLLDTGHRNAAENMALDDVILECRSNNLVPNTVRFLQFDPPAVLVGYHQEVEHEVRLDYVRRNGIDVNRRLTGGGAVYFDKTSLGWEVIASKASIPFYRHIEELFKVMCKGPIHALNTLGIRAAFRPKNDIEVSGRKISGTGGVEGDGTFLFQGTLLIDFDVETMARALRIPIVKLKDKELRSVKERVTCVKWELGYHPSYEAIKRALKRGFERALEIKLVRSGLTAVEEKILGERLPKFQSDKWIFSDRRPLNEAPVLQAVDKRPGGLIRVSLALDRRTKLIKSILITGDFFIFPSRAILDLEAALKFAPCDAGRIRSLIHAFFSANGVQMPGVTADDLTNLILEAADKASYESLGISLAEANYLYPVTKYAMSVLGNSCNYLLLPYCAKLSSCEYRKTDGCAKCGGCSVGEAYELAEAIGLKPVTILNFEHLMDTLKIMKTGDMKGYLGCCCEAFYCKHRDELEGIGVPGIIVDIDDQTCYDLGKEEEAYRGNFEAQTQLKIELLTKLLNWIGREKTSRNGTEKCRTSMS